MLIDLSSRDVNSKSKEVSESIITKETTSAVENYFGIIKSGLKSRQQFRITQFILKQKIMVQGIWNELQTVDPHMVVAKMMKTIFHQKTQVFIILVICFTSESSVGWINSTLCQSCNLP